MKLQINKSNYITPNIMQMKNRNTFNSFKIQTAIVYFAIVSTIYENVTTATV